MAIIFEDIYLDWQGVSYKLSGDGAFMEALASVEDHLTLPELYDAQQSGKMPLAKLSNAYAVLLRHAGAVRISAAEVYADMWEDDKTVAKITEAVTKLMLLMTPPKERREIEDQEAPQDKDAKPTVKKKKSGSGKNKSK